VSLITHPASLVRARQRSRPTARLTTGVGGDLMRLSVELEDVEDLTDDDLRQALGGA